MALGNILITCVPTPSGTVTTKYRDGDDSAANPPSTPEIGQPLARSATEADIPLVTASTGGTSPLRYELEVSSTSAVAGFSVAASSADFSGDGVYQLTGLTAATNYWVRLACVDAISRRSGYSGTFSFTTPAAAGGDSTAPTAPSNVTATSTVAGQCVISWTAGTDAVGITATDILRGDADGAGVPLNSGAVIATITSGTTYTDLSAPFGQQVYYRVQHRDAAGNTSDQSARVFVTVAAASGTKLRWAPGHYFRPGLGDAVSATVSQIAAFDSRVTGVIYIRYWKDLESSKGVYSGTGWSDISAVATACKAANKRLILRLQDRRFNSTNATSAVPAYLANDGGIDKTYFRTNTGNTCAGAKMWRSDVMQYAIDLQKRMIDLYADQVCADGKPLLVGIGGEESIFGAQISSNYSDYVGSDYIDLEIGRANALRAYRPEVAYWLYTNWVTEEDSNKTLMKRYFANARANPGIFCSYGPDTRWILGAVIDGHDVLVGTVGGVDHRGSYPILGSTENIELNAGKTVAEIYAAAVTDVKANYMSWSGANSYWATTVYPYLTGRPTVTTVPTSLTGLVTVL